VATLTSKIAAFEV